jgi:hypothetical protein
MRSFWLKAAILIWVIFTIIAPPGLPSCWMEREPCEVHPHFNQKQAETPHSHFYLIDLSLGLASQPYPFLSAASILLIALLAASGAKARRDMILPFFTGHRWLAAPEPPPPKAFLFI